MATYVLLLRHTDDGRRAIKDAPARIQLHLPRAQTAGIAVRSVHLTLGDYDYVVQIEAPDDTTLAALLLGLEQQGYVRATLLRAFPLGDAGRILQQIP